jgi:hypothetical protein
MLSSEHLAVSARCSDSSLYSKLLGRLEIGRIKVQGYTGKEV